MSIDSLPAPGAKPRVNAWLVAMVIILVLALASRFAMLGERATSHDETTHAKYSWNLYSGRGFAHDPLMHGTVLFEASALFYFLFGVSSFTARIYTALTGVAVVMVPFLFRRWLGRAGALIASVMFLISPAITYYSRYTRHDLPLILYSFLLLWAVLSYLDGGKLRHLIGAGAFFALMFASKENAYIYTAIFLALLALPFIWRVLTTRWQKPELFLPAVALVIVIVILGLVFVLAARGAEVVVTGEGEEEITTRLIPWWGRASGGAAFLAVLALLVVCVCGVGRAVVGAMRLFDVLMVLGTLTLPLGSALIMKYIAGLDMKPFYPALMNRTLGTLPHSAGLTFFLVLGIMLGLAAALGIWWRRQYWLPVAAVHYAVFIFTFSTLFTYGWGVLTGFVGGLAYWMGQQSVQRGSQPWFYYPLVGPLYEYFPILIAIFAGAAAFIWPALKKPAKQEGDAPAPVFDDGALVQRFLPLFLVGWIALSWVAYTVAGEKMPWLFTHIAFPNILLAAWGLDKVLDKVTWRDITSHFGWVLGVAIFFLWRALTAFRQSSGSLRQLLQQAGASEGLAWTLEQLQPIGRVAGGVGGIIICSGLLLWAINRLGPMRALRLALATLVLLLGMATLRTMVMLNYYNYALPTEYIVYAHATPDVSLVLDKVEDLSWRVTGTRDQLQVAYGKEVAWPFYWYMDSLYPNNYYYGSEPEQERLLASPAIIAAKDEWPAVDAIVGDSYVHYDYKHIWWPIEDYKNLTWARLREVLSDPSYRIALWNIIVNRDYTQYASLRNPEAPFTLKTWPHRMEFRFYVRRDLAQELWGYRSGDADAASGEDTVGPLVVDPFVLAERSLELVARATLPDAAPRGIAAAPDGSFLISDSAQHRIWHYSSEGIILNVWGGYGTDPGLFNQPWGLATDPAGYLYVADTWNHRIQVFDPDGQHIRTWGRLGEADVDDPAGEGMFLGPRDVAVGPAGEIFVADTGNHRVQIFDPEGRFVRQFGGAGSAEGLLREPVGLAINLRGEVFVADVWNQRVQVFTQSGASLRMWDISTWAAMEREDRPFLTIDGDFVYIADPAGPRVLAYAEDGSFLWALRGDETVQSIADVAVADGKLAVTDPVAGEIRIYALPETP